VRRSRTVVADRSLGHDCVRLDLQADSAWTGEGALHWRRDVVAFWCPVRLTAGSPVYRVGWFQRYQVADEPVDVDASTLVRSPQFAASSN
jgi:hypothetical protein